MWWWSSPGEGARAQLPAVNVLLFLFFIYFKIYFLLSLLSSLLSLSLSLAVSGLSCGTQDLSLWHMGFSLVVACGFSL